jgi:hypothetical protein
MIVAEHLEFGVFILLVNLELHLSWIEYLSMHLYSGRASSHLRAK